MSEKMKDYYKIKFIRGATTASGNSVMEIEAAVVGINWWINFTKQSN